MGWLFNTQPCSKQAFVEQLLREFPSIKEHKLVGNNLWTLVQAVPPGSSDRTGIVLFLLERHDGCWGWKDVGVTSGPFEVNCPLHFLQRSDDDDDYSFSDGTTWRQQVRDWHAERKQRRASSSKLVVGSKVQLGKPFAENVHGVHVITADYGRRGLLLNSGWRILANQKKYLTLVNS